MDLPTFLVVVIGAAVNLLLLYVVVRVAIIHGMRRARREEWTETYDVKHAHWLTSGQKAELAGRAPQIG